MPPNPEFIGSNPTVDPLALGGSRPDELIETSLAQALSGASNGGGGGGGIVGTCGAEQNAAAGYFFEINGKVFLHCFHI